MTGVHDVYLHLPKWLTDSTKDNVPTKLTVVFFLTGNPALIGYYDEFLQLLAQGSGRDAVIAGASLAGFEAKTQSPSSDLAKELLHPPNFEQKPIYDLHDQIRLCDQRLNHLISRIGNDYAMENMPVVVVLVGHSLGTYIALELVNRHIRASNEGKVAHYTIRATVLLTATIYDLSKSSSGRIATPILSNVPFFPALLQVLSSTLTSTLPVSWLRAVVSKITGMSGHGLDVTAQFLRRPGAVRQALYLAKCELDEIGEDKWSAEIWGASVDSKVEPDSTQTTAPKHFILFAVEDHWVANETRKVIEKKSGSNVKIVVDEKVVHAWCIAQSKYVADIVNGWLQEVL